MTNAVATIPHQPRSVLVDMSSRYGMEPAAFEATVRATCMSGQTVSREQFAAFLLVAKEYDLNPLTKEIYAFPTRGGGIQPIVSIDGWMSMINDHPACDGLEFEDHFGEDGKLAAITCRIYRKDRSRPTTVTEYMAECRRNTDVWKQWPARMLRHKAAIQCGRYAFGFSGIMEPDEWERAQSVPQAQPTGLRARLDERRGKPSEGFMVHHAPEAIAAPQTAEDVPVDPDTGEVVDDAHEPAMAEETAYDDADNIREPEDEFPGDAAVQDAFRNLLSDIEADLAEATTIDAVNEIARSNTADLKAMPIEDQARARKMIAEARQRVGGAS